MIPEEVNWLGLIEELNHLGLKDSKIELACEFTPGYISQLKCGNVKKVGDYTKGAKLVNLLDRERKRD